MKTSALILALFAFGAAPPRLARAAFEDTGAAARAIGMGNAFSAVADDAQAPHYNPAGLAGLPGPRLLTSYGKLHLGLDDGSAIGSGFLSYAHPLPGRAGTAGVSWSHTSLAGWYQEHAIRGTYAVRLTTAVAAGLSVKRLAISIGRDQYTAADPVFDYGGKSGVSAWSLDAGLLWRSAGPWRAGVSVFDLNRPDVGFSESVRQPPGFRAGAAFVTEVAALASDLSYRDGDIRVHCGAERWTQNRTFAGRGGLTIGNRQLAALSLGFGAGLGRVRADYAFLYPLAGITGTLGTHQFALSFAFGTLPATRADRRRDQESERVSELAGEVSALRKVVESLEKKTAAPPPPPRPARPKTAPKAPPKNSPVLHTVRGGENLRSIAVDYYGNPKRWIDIYRANRRAVGPEGGVNPGVVLTIPPDADRSTQ